MRAALIVALVISYAAFTLIAGAAASLPPSRARTWLRVGIALGAVSIATRTVVLLVVA